jgi:Mitochondrial ribosomal protein (VAR1)
VYNYNNNEIVKVTKPLILTKKLNNSNLKTIPLNNTKNTLGPMRYFPPTNQEWFNSIYVYNNTYTKNITIANKNLSKLIKSYFNLYFSKKLLYSKRVLARFKKLAINKIFISKAELKHTNSKVIITLYIYDEERRILLNRLKRIEAILFPSFKLSLNEFHRNKALSLFDKLSIIKQEKEKISLKIWLEECRKHIIEEIDLEKKVLETINKLKSKNQKKLEIEILEEKVIKISSIIAICENDPIIHQKYEDMYNKFVSKTFLERDIFVITYFKLLLRLNKSKFEDKFLLRLKPFISKIYNKEIEFNIINLKAVYLNSDIFTQVIALKLKNRNNRLLTVLRYFLHMVKLPKVNLLKERFSHINIRNLWNNKVKNLTLKSSGLNKKRDDLDLLLISLFPNSNFLKKSERQKFCKSNNIFKHNLNINLLNYVLNNLKHKNIGGVRLEAKGRLTRRFTASRSVFKIKWKGSLKNIDSSYGGLSSIILRGHVKSNLQYSTVNSKTRNGAFGLKGWISGK